MLQYLSQRFTYLSENDWRGQLALGRISKNGEPCLTEAAVVAGDAIAFAVDQTEFPEPEADLDFRIIFADEWLLGINKPGNLLVHRQGRSLTNNLIYQLRHAHRPPYPEAGVVNRLDRETSGLVLVARRPAFLARLNALFAERLITKTYLAVAHGTLQAPQGMIDAPIGRDPESAVSYRYSAGPQAVAAKAALTRYQVLAEYANCSLLRLHPESGRTHQLRVHLAHIGHPIMNDKLYGRTDQEFLAWRGRPLAAGSAPQVSRQALHAESLTFVHPWTGKEVQIVAELPRDMRQWLEENAAQIPSPRAFQGEGQGGG